MAGDDRMDLAICRQVLGDRGSGRIYTYIIYIYDYIWIYIYIYYYIIYILFFGFPCRVLGVLVFRADDPRFSRVMWAGSLPKNAENIIHPERCIASSDQSPWLNFSHQTVWYSVHSVRIDSNLRIGHLFERCLAPRCSKSPHQTLPRPRRSGSHILSMRWKLPFTWDTRLPRSPPMAWVYVYIIKYIYIYYIYILSIYIYCIYILCIYIYIVYILYIYCVYIYILYIYIYILYVYIYCIYIVYMYIYIYILYIYIYCIYIVYMYIYIYIVYIYIYIVYIYIVYIYIVYMYIYCIYIFVYCIYIVYILYIYCKYIVYIYIYCIHIVIYIYIYIYCAYIYIVYILYIYIYCIYIYCIYIYIPNQSIRIDSNHAQMIPMCFPFRFFRSQQLMVGAPVIFCQ